MITIWHNPRCSKSRQTLALLEDRGLRVHVRRYLDEPPSADEITAALAALGLHAPAILRRGEAAWTELGLGPDTDDAALIAAMAERPILIERPIVFRGNRAVIGRPPEQVLDLL
jgi:arsenate reductase